MTNGMELLALYMYITTIEHNVVTNMQLYKWSIDHLNLCGILQLFQLRTFKLNWETDVFSTFLENVRVPRLLTLLQQYETILTKFL